MAATLRYGRERAHLGRSLLNFMRIARDAHAPDLTLGEVGDLLFTAIEVFIGHAFERPMVLSELSRNLEMPRNIVRRKLQRLIEIGLVECIDHRYYMTAKAKRAASARSALGAPSQYPGGDKRSVQNERRRPLTVRKASSEMRASQAP